MVRVGWNELLSRAGKFFERELWQRETAQLPWLHRTLWGTTRTVTIVGRGFVEDQLLLRASALTYSTLLALVPFFALAFAVLKGLGVQNQVEPWLVGQVAEGARETVSKIVDYVNQTDVRALGALGLVMLVFTVVSVISNVEKSLNTIWGVKTPRRWARRFTDYISLVVLGPIFLFITLAVTTTVEAKTGEFIRGLHEIPVLGWIAENLVEPLPALSSLLPYIFVWAFFTFLYLYLPNIKVRFTSALLAGFIAGILWQLMQWGYVRFQIGVAQYNAIYGTLAQLPLLLIWLYFSWVVFLLGAEIAFAHQHLRTYAREREASAYSYADREALGLRAMVEIARNFVAGESPWTAERLSVRLNAPLRLVNDTLFQIKEGGLLVITGGEQDCQYLLSKDLDSIRIYEILDVLRRYSSSPGGVIRARDPLVSNLLEKLEKSEREAFKEWTLRKALKESV